MNETEKTEIENASWFDRTIYKILTWLKLTSGIGIVGLGGFWFLYGIMQFMTVSASSALQQQVQETFFLQAEMGLLIVAVGILIMETKRQKK